MSIYGFEQDENQFFNLSKRINQKIDDKIIFQTEEIQSKNLENPDLPLTEVDLNDQKPYFNIFNYKDDKFDDKLSSQNVNKMEDPQNSPLNSIKIDMRCESKSTFNDENLRKSRNFDENPKISLKNSESIDDIIEMEVVEEEKKENKVEDIKGNKEQKYNFLDLYKINFKKTQETSVLTLPASKNSLPQMNREDPFFNQNDSIVSDISKKDAEQYLYGSNIEYFMVKTTFFE